MLLYASGDFNDKKGSFHFKFLNLQNLLREAEALNQLANCKLCVGQ